MCSKRFLVVGLAAKRRVVEQLPKISKCRVAVGQPQQHQFFDHDLAMRDPVGGAGQVCIRPGFSAVDRRGRKLFDKDLEDAVELLRPEISGKQRQDLRPQTRRPELPVARHHQVQDLVDQPQCVEAARPHRTFGVVVHVTLFVEAVGELTGRSEIGKDNVAGHRKQGVRQTIGVADLPRDVELAHSTVDGKQLEGRHLRIRGHHTDDFGFRISDFEFPDRLPPLRRRFGWRLQSSDSVMAIETCSR